MKTNLLKVCELTGAALDWAVANIEENVPVAEFIALEKLPESDYFWKYRYSTNWAQGGPIIEREGIDMLRLRANINNDVEDRGWRAYHTPTREAVTHCYAEGPTPLIAAMRCYVASKLGADVDVPKELS